MSINPITHRSQLVQTQPKRASKLHDYLVAYAFLSPALITLLIFGIFPLGYAFYMSLFRWRIVQGEYVGLENYLRALGDPHSLLFVVGGLFAFFVAWLLWERASRSASAPRMTLQFLASLLLIGTGWTLLTHLPILVETGDDDFYQSLSVTLWYAIGSVPIQLICSLILASILYRNIAGRETFRMIFFLPYITPVVASAAIFRVMFDPRENGLMNQLLALFSLSPQLWLREQTGIFDLLLPIDLPGILAGPSMALSVVILFNIWMQVGFNTVIYLAGLAQIPLELYDAAEVDGANRWGLFRYITIPLLSPTTFFLSVLGVITSFKAFSEVYVLGGSRSAVSTASVFIFEEFYRASKFGYAAALTFILFAIIVSLTIVQNRVAERKVFYG